MNYLKRIKKVYNFGENLLLEIIASDHNVIYEYDMQEANWLCNLFIFPPSGHCHPDSSHLALFKS